MLGWRLPRRRPFTPAATHAVPWLSRHGQRGVHQRHLDVAADAGPRPLDQRRLDAVGREQPADEVDDRGAGLQRPPVRLAGDRHQPAHRLQQEVVAGQPGGRLASCRTRSPSRRRAPGSRARSVVRREPEARRSAPAGRTRSSRRRARPASRASAQVVRRRGGPARSSACCGSGRGSRCDTPSRHGGPQARVSSPPSGRSTLITSAPRSPSSIAASGPASTREKSATRIPSSGGMGGHTSAPVRTLVISDLHLGRADGRRPPAPRRTCASRCWRRSTTSTGS